MTEMVEVSVNLIREARALPQTSLPKGVATREETGEGPQNPRLK